MDKDYLDRFESKLQQDLVFLCTSYKMLDGSLPASDDIEARWHDLAPEYVADAVYEIQDYPTVSVGWAGYLGMAVAYGWDSDWTRYSKAEYKSYYGPRGFDDMDEHIVSSILRIPLESADAKSIEDMLRRCAQSAVDHIRHEQIEPQSPTAFHVFARACKVMFRIGAGIELKRLGYKFEKMDMGN